MSTGKRIAVAIIYTCLMMMVVGELHASIDSVDTDNIICFGDFNADPNRGRFWGSVSEFCASYNFRLVDSILPYDSFSFISAAHNTTTMYFKGRVTLFFANNYLTEYRITMEF